MNAFLNFLIGLIITSVLGAITLFLCLLTDYKDEIWDNITPKE